MGSDTTRNEACPLCGCTEASLFLSRRSRLGEKLFDWVRCAGCGVIRVSPLPTPEEITQMYGDEAYVESDSIAGNVAGRSAIEDLIYEDAQNQLRKLSDYVGGGRLLDIGCAHGEFLQAASELGYTVEGLEPNPQMAAAASRRGFTVHQCTIEEADLQAGAFDLINLNHILEHIRRPKAIIQKVSEALKPGGVVHIRVPTALNSLYFKLPVHLVRLSRTLRIGGIWEPGKPPYHLWEFTPRLVRALLGGAGLDVEYSRADEGLPNVSFGEGPGTNLWQIRSLKGFLRVGLSYPLKALSVLIARHSSWGDQTEAVGIKPHDS